MKPLKLDRLLGEQDANEKYKKNADETWGDARNVPSRKGKPYFPKDPEMDSNTTNHYVNKGMDIRRAKVARGQR